MDGSQLPTEWTHQSKKLVPGVSDSKKRDMSLIKTDVDKKEGPMFKKSDVPNMPKTLKMSDTSKKVNVAKSFESGTVG